MLKQLYAYYSEHPEKMSGEYRELIARGESIPRAVCDYVSGMTDQFSIEKFKEVFVPKAWEIY